MNFISKLFKPDINQLERKRNVKKLIRLLKRKLYSTDDLETRGQAAQALSRLGAVNAIEPMRQCLEEMSQFIKILKKEMPPVRDSGSLYDGNLIGPMIMGGAYASEDLVSTALSDLEKQSSAQSNRQSSKES